MTVGDGETVTVTDKVRVIGRVRVTDTVRVTDRVRVTRERWQRKQRACSRLAPVS